MITLDGPGEVLNRSRGVVGRPPEVAEDDGKLHFAVDQVEDLDADRSDSGPVLGMLACEWRW
jgi:hypothetical protein